MAADPTLDRTSSRRGLPQSTPSRSQSTRSKHAVLPTPHRTHSAHHRSSSRHGAVEERPPHVDYEHSTRRSSSRDRPSLSQAESSRGAGSSHHHRSHHSRHSRDSRDMSTAVANGGGPAPVVTPQETRQSGRSGKSRTTIPAQTGNWVLGKTIGAGSMGKVKLARRPEGGEQVAVKIVPRGSTEDGHNQSRADRERADHSKEVRTAREAAIVTLLDHPYICGMRDVVRTTYHWYMLFEYVNGGQMLDYIISHGRLKEKQARKFSRQIASALDYCHRNSIAHRDLKIENILISKTGDIKIIDFGLSNLFAPRNHLKTFCGSLYFAAPELLQAKAYTGPEVDVWSFGIVLYVLVCGKVPFDDQSMPALHAKIKKGLVDYPNWLSPECRNLISRMLVTDPKQRASLQEIMNHPWMIKGFGSPPENYLPVRDPIQLPLDPAVILAMTGFDFGPPELIQAQLTEVIDSPEYQRAVRVAAQEREMQGPPRDTEKRRGFGFDFYKRRSSTNSRDTLTAPSSEGLALGNDPVNAYHPLISVYYLVREKQERDRLAVNPGATTMPRSPGEAPLATVPMPELAPPEAAHTNSAAYEMKGEKATGGRSRPRARTHGEDDVTDSMKHLKIPGSGGPTSPAIVETPPEQTHHRKESTAAGILRRFSTRRRKETSEKNFDKSHPPQVHVKTSEEYGTLRKSFSVRRTRERNNDHPPSSMLRSGSSQPQHSDLLAPPRSADNNARNPKGLGRSASVNSAEFRRKETRGGASDAPPPPRVTYKEPPPTNGSDHSTANEKTLRESEPKTLREPEPRTPGHLNPKSAATRAKSLGHARRESIQARRARRDEAREANVPEETDLEGGDASGLSTDRVDTAENVKPVFLKGLFSVSTTSTKPVHAIRADIIRVLRQLGVEYTEIRGGFHCRHTPSIDLKKVVDLPPSSHGNQTPGHRRRISFGGFMGGNSNSIDREREEFREAEKPPHTPRTPGRHIRNDTSYTNSDASDESVSRDHRGSSARAVGETSTHVQSELGGSMILEFEIFIVKVPLLSLHGVQFKRLAGGTWQYKNMADQVLRELRL
ncbi:serine/threonine protein kinase-like protein Kin1 [Amylocarpus encephaloides]|uniref:non-specific serine/threonine protein kinase n=1 Tax=Amylocarpus encephaloides TaxID=45428 RepID=A0A9P7Y8M7_9HELO|nr:serine/threonine protein kinase-like protein Kin1 [Amylocarpus encephaloides]